jgi:branched-chain amino acid transport system ATP-binding protein
MLELKNLSGGWGPTMIVENVSLTIETGETVAAIGRNGVGKSTLLEIITGRARWRSGSIVLDGVELSQLPIHRRAWLGLGYVPQNREVFPSLTVREHLAIAQRPGRWTRSEVLKLFPSLAARQANLGGQLSGGEQQMLAIARALLGNPKVILMDEPSEGLAPVVVEALMKAIGVVMADGSLAVLLVEQRVDIALDVSSRCIVMERGKIAHEMTTEQLKKNDQSIAELMGLGAS